VHASMAKQTVADQFADILGRAGATRRCGVVGDGLDPVVDAVRRGAALEWVYVRAEARISLQEALAVTPVVSLCEAHKPEPRPDSGGPGFSFLVSCGELGHLPSCSSWCSRCSCSSSSWW
jgi:hypothetical protein